MRELRLTIRAAREEVEKRIQQARRADLKLAQLASLSGESFEEFVAELSRCSISKSRKSAARATRAPTCVSEAPRRPARRRSVQVSQARLGRLARAPEVSGNDSPHPQPEGLLRHDQHVHALGREVRRRKPDRASGRPATGRAGAPGDGPETETRDRASLILKRLCIMSGESKSTREPDSTAHVQSFELVFQR